MQTDTQMYVTGITSNKWIEKVFEKVFSKHDFTIHMST